MRILIDCTETAHSRQHSGIPQVVRHLCAHFPDPGRQCVVRDRFTGWWRPADARERRWLDPHHHVGEDGKVRAWGDWQKVRGWLQARLGRPPRLFGRATALIVPELYYPVSRGSFREIQAQCGGPVVAVFHDAVAIRHPEFAPPFVAEHFKDYIDDLRHVDAVAAVSQASRRELLEYWHGRGWHDHPPVTVIPLGTGLSGHAGELLHPDPGGLPLVLFVSTLEPRKNHVAALAAAERLWAEGLRFRLEFAGGCNAEVRAEWDQRLRAVKAPAGCFTWHGRVSRERLRALYRAARFTVYPSHWEGFGLPVLESLSFGRPCLCSNRGGLAEVAAGGGCLVVDPGNPDAIAAGWRLLLTDQALYDQLSDEARRRTFRSWDEYANDVRQWLQSVEKRPVPFTEACRNEQAALNLLRPQVAGMAAVARALRERWRALQAAAEPFQYPEPERTFAAATRTADLAAWTDGRRAVSLDVFDTCLVRLLPEPEEIFRMLGERVERLTGQPAQDFAACRRATEDELRRIGLSGGGREDTSLQAVYSGLAARLSWDSTTRAAVMAAETELERFFLQAVPEVRGRAWELYAEGLLAAYTSEMYLPSDVLRGLLAGCGFPVEGVVVLTSGETGKSKGTGNLYRLLLERLPGRDLLHVGDNPVSDGEVPAALGIATAVIRTAKETYPDRFSNLLHAATLQELPADMDFWEEFGYRVAGPVHAAFATWIYRQCRDRRCESLHFLSRDGWLPMRVFGQLQEGWGAVADSRYLYASREFLGLGAITTIGPDEWDFLLKASPLLTVRDVFARLGLGAESTVRACARHGLGDPDRLLCHHWGYRDPRDRDRLYAAVCDHIGEFLAHQARIRDSLRGYLEAEGLFKAASLVVDLGWGGSSLKALRAMAPAAGAPPHGLYFALLAPSVEAASDCFTAGPPRDARIRLLKGSIALLEFLFGSPEPTARTMAREAAGWRPVFRRELPACDRQAWVRMESGVRRFIARVMTACPRPPEGDGLACVEDTLRRLVFHPTADELRALGPILHNEGWGTDNCLRLLPRREALDHPAALHEAMCYAPWKPGLAALMAGNPA